MSSPIETWAGELGELRAISTAGGGTLLTTVAQLIPIPDASKHLFCTPRNFTTAVVVKIALSPYLLVLKTPDNLATATHYSQFAQDGLTTTEVNLDALDTLANLDYLLIGSHLPFRGVNVVMNGAKLNANASVLTVAYWNGTAWVTTSASDGTAAAGATFGQSGDVTWTVPAAWTKDTLINIGTPGSAVINQGMGLYWTRWSVSAALSAATRATGIVAYNRSTAYSEWLPGQLFQERITKGFQGIAAVEALTDAGTANLVINVASRYKEAFLS